MMKSLRALVSVLVTASFLAIAASGAVLFLAPPGRIANWTDWTILGLTKDEWSGLHIVFASLFLLAALLHVWLNWRPLVGYFKTRQHRFRWEWIAAVLLCLAVYLGLRASIPPFSSLVAFSDRLKYSWDDPRRRGPVPHAELLTLAEVARSAQLEWSTVESRLANAGIQGVHADAILGEVAAQNRISAENLYQKMTDLTPTMPGAPGRGGHGQGGFGRRTLAEFCAAEGVALEDALRRLRDNGISATADSTLRELAAAAGYDRPSAILEILRNP